jgi:hypothetical protein
LRSIAFTQRRGDATKKLIYFFCLAIQKFDEKEQSKKSRRKIFFSGISEAAPATGGQAGKFRLGLDFLVTFVSRQK